MEAEPNKTVEEMYWDHVRAMSPAEKYGKMSRLNAGVRAMVETRIREQRPGIGDRALKFAVARRMYWDEPNILKMIDAAETEQRRTTSDPEQSDE